MELATALSLCSLMISVPAFGMAIYTLICQKVQKSIEQEHHSVRLSREQGRSVYRTPPIKDRPIDEDMLGHPEVYDPAGDDMEQYGF
jgi:hypothetical protein